MAKRSTEVKRSSVNGQLVDGGPQLQLVSVAVALVTVVSPAAQVD